MKRILIFGASGLVGNALWNYVNMNTDYMCVGTVNTHNKLLKKNKRLIIFNVFKNIFGNSKQTDSGTDVTREGNRQRGLKGALTGEESTDRIRRMPLLEGSLTTFFNAYQFDWVINCIADINQKPTDLSQYFFINSIFPQLLSTYSKQYNFKLIHISTNGVFSGKKQQPYTDKDTPDAKDIYGLSKRLSEKINGIIIRTSFIGHSVERNKGLIDWFLQQKTEITGYDKAFWNGITTLTLAKIIDALIKNDSNPSKHPIHIASETLSKYKLLKLIQQIYHHDVKIKKDTTIEDHRTLIPSAIQKELITMPTLQEQIQELKTFYAKN
jgi:dTDP-4-dehydrorhamnose reductase